MTDHLERALQLMDRAEGDMQYEGQREWIIEQAKIHAQLATAQAVNRLVDLIEEKTDQDFLQKLWAVD